MKIIEVKDLHVFLGGMWVLDGVNLEVNKGDIFAIVGGSGSGKTTIMRSIIMLQKPTSGVIKVFGEDIWASSTDRARELRQRWGVMFQHAALFSSLTVMENVMFPLQEFTDLSDIDCQELACLKIALVGLHPSASSKYPGELSGGMQKRAALARAIALDPELLFLDEPTSGLDPKGAEAFDDLVLHLKESLNLTIMMVTHDLDSLWATTDQVAFIGEGKILASEPIKDLIRNKNPVVQNYFSGKRGHLRFAGDY